jgi:DNA processing protein
MMDREHAWLLLTKTPGLGNVKINNLIKHFESIEDVFSQSRFPSHLKIPAAAVSAIKNPDFKKITNDVMWLEKQGNHMLTIDSDLYPPLLKQINSPPPILFVTGDPDVLLQPQLAVVGSRNATPVGLKNTQLFCHSLARSHITITSGMALGVDGKAHRAALDAGGKTIAVMGTGLDIVYPAKHKELAHDIAQNGALISEFPVGTKAHAHNFPQRNRIICGLSLGTLVIEAGMQSGTLITARQTMEINRPVMAIPGSIHCPTAKGCHLLIKQGAKLVESAEEIIEELAPLAQSLSLQIKEKLDLLDKKPYITVESDGQEQILSLVYYEPTPIDEIINKSGLSAQEVSSVLLILELEDKIQTLPGAHYIRI